MPRQKPISLIISRSYIVRWCSRCASTTLPSLDKELFVLVKLFADRLDRSLDRRASTSHSAFSDRSAGAFSCFLYHLAKQRIDRVDCVDLVAPELDPIRLFLITRIKLDDIAANAKTPRSKSIFTRSYCSSTSRCRNSSRLIFIPGSTKISMP